MAGDLSDREIIIIAVAASVTTLLASILVAVLIYYCYCKRRRFQQSSKRLAHLLDRYTLQDPLEELVRRESGRSSYTNTSPSFVTSTSGEGVVRQRKLYRVWSHDRTTKQFVLADSMHELLEKATHKFSMRTPVTFVLESDGTRIETDEVLSACAGLVLLALEEGQKWSPDPHCLSVGVKSFDYSATRDEVDSGRGMSQEGETSSDSYGDEQL